VALAVAAWVAVRAHRGRAPGSPTPRDPVKMPDRFGMQR
jgi:hypothetical protein